MLNVTLVNMVQLLRFSVLLLLLLNLFIFSFRCFKRLAAVSSRHVAHAHTIKIQGSQEKQKPTTSQVQMETCGGVKSSTCPNFFLFTSD